MAESRRLVEDLFQDEGVNPLEQEHNSGGKLRDRTHPNVIFTRFGPFRNPSDVKAPGGCFIFLAVLGAVVMICFSSYRIHTLKGREEPYSSEIVMLIFQIGCLYYICHGVLFELLLDMIISAIAMALDVIYYSVDFAKKGDNTVLSYAILGSNLAFGLVLCVAGIIGAHSYYGNESIVCSIITTEPLKTYYNYLRWLHSVLVFDFQLAVSSVIFYWVDSQVDTEEGVVLGVGIGVNLIFFFAGKIAIRLENHWGTVIFMSLGSFHFSFLLFKTVKQWDGIRSEVFLDVISLVFSIASAGIRLFVLVWSGKITKKYGQGLKEKLFGDQQPQQPTYESANVQQRETHDRSSAEDYISM